MRVKWNEQVEGKPRAYTGELIQFVPVMAGLEYGSTGYHKATFKNRIVAIVCDDQGNFIPVEMDQLRKRDSTCPAASNSAQV